MGDAFEILFDVVVVTSMVLLVRLYKKDSQPLRAAFFSFTVDIILIYILSFYTEAPKISARAKVIRV